MGVISLLEDYEDRLVEVKDNFTNLSVKVLSKLDWAVSKLNSPKLLDIENVDSISREDLLWIKSNLHLYCGLSEEKAGQDLDYLLNKVYTTNEFM